MSAQYRSTHVPSQPGTGNDAAWRIDWAAVVIGLVVFCLAFAAVLTLGAIARATDPLLNVPAPASTSLPPCATEDSDNCYWDADTMGNGRGQDSIVIRDGVANVMPEGE